MSNNNQVKMSITNSKITLKIIISDTKFILVSNTRYSANIKASASPSDDAKVIGDIGNRIMFLIENGEEEETYKDRFNRIADMFTGVTITSFQDIKTALS